MANATLDSFRTLLADTRDAVASGNFSTAWSKLAQAGLDRVALAQSMSVDAASETLSSLQDAERLLERAELAASRLPDDRRLVTLRTRRSR